MSQATDKNIMPALPATANRITRRGLLAGGTAALAVAGAALPSQALNSDTDADPVVILWRQYQPAEDEARRLGDRISEIAEGLPEHPGVNLGMVHAIAPTGLAAVGRPNLTRCPEDIERFASDMMSDRLGFDAATRATWIEARKAELVEVNRQVKERERAAGLLDLRDKQDELDGISGDLYAQIEKAAATTPGGHAVKLLIAFEHTENSKYLVDLPCCLYASMLRDLLPFCPKDIAVRARVFVEAGTDQSDIRRVGDCLDLIRGVEGNGGEV
jgi:hypothetical protein